MFFVEADGKRVNVNSIDTIRIVKSNAQYFKVEIKRSKKEYGHGYSKEIEEQAFSLSERIFGVFISISGNQEKPTQKLNDEDYFFMVNNYPPHFQNRNHEIKCFEGTYNECEWYIRDLEVRMNIRYWLPSLLSGLLGALIMWFITKG